MDAQYLEGLKEKVVNNPIQYVNMAGIQLETLEEGHIRATLPASQIHLNHVGTMYAGSMFVLAEALGGSLLLATYNGDYIPVLKGVEMHYLKPTKKDLVFDVSISEQEAAEKIAPVAERGRGNYFLNIPIYDADGVHVYDSTFNYYLFAKDKISEFSA